MRIFPGLAGHRVELWLMGTLSGEPSAPTLFSVSPFPQCLPVAHLTGGSISPEAPRLDGLPAAQLRARQLGAAVSGPPRGSAVPGGQSLRPGAGDPPLPTPGREMAGSVLTRSVVVRWA